MAKLVVVEAFDDFRRGDEITDSTIINGILGTGREQSVHVIPDGQASTPFFTNTAKED